MAIGSYLNVKEILLKDEDKIDLLITEFYEQREDYKTYVPHQRDTV